MLFASQVGKKYVLKKFQMREANKNFTDDSYEMILKIYSEVKKKKKFTS